MALMGDSYRVFSQLALMRFKNLPEVFLIPVHLHYVQEYLGGNSQYPGPSPSPGPGINYACHDAHTRRDYKLALAAVVETLKRTCEEKEASPTGPLHGVIKAEGVLHMAGIRGGVTRDTLYDAGINALRDFVGVGICLYGQQVTLDKKHMTLVRYSPISSPFPKWNVECLTELDRYAREQFGFAPKQMPLLSEELVHG